MKTGWVLWGALAANMALTVILVLVTGRIDYAVAPSIGRPNGFGGQSLSQQAPAAVNSHPIVEEGCAVSDRFPQEVRQWCELITFYARQYDLHPDLLAALIWQESGGNPEAYSRSGAVGLMQIMPRDGKAASFNCINGPCFADRPATAELWDPEYNISYGSSLLADLHTYKGSVREALKSYGPMSVGYTYADKVLGLFQQYGNP